MRFFSLVMLAVWVCPCAAQQTRLPAAEAGQPLLQNYSPLDYNAHGLNLAAVQGAQGMMYFANGDGLLEYDGASWRFFTLHGNRRIYDFAVSDSGTIFVGGEDDLGYLGPDAEGQVDFVSLRHHLPATDRSSFEARKVHATSAGIFFNTSTHLFRWDGLRFHTWSPATPFTASAQVEDRVFIGSAEGVLDVRGDSLHLLPGTERLGNAFMMALRYDSRHLLFGTATHLYLYDGRALTPFQDAAGLAAQSPFTAICRLPDGTLALGTQDAGLIHLDTDGHRLQVLNEESGLRDNEIVGLYLDHDQRLWLTLMDGLAWVDLVSPVTSFGADNGLQGRVEAIRRHSGHLYVGTSTGLYRLAPARPPESTAHFESVNGLSGFVYDLLLHEAGLLAVTEDGLYQVNGLKATLIASMEAFTLERLPGNPNQVFIGGPGGLFSLRYDPQHQRWGVPEQVGNLNAIVREMGLGTSGDLWLILLPGGLARVTFSNTPDAPIQIERFGQEHALPVGELSVIPDRDGVLVASIEGLFRFHEEAQRFYPDSAFGAAFAEGRKILLDPISTPNGVWSSVRTDGSNATLQVARFSALEQGRYATDSLVVLRLLPPTVAWDFYVDGFTSDAITWIATSEGLFRYDPSHAQVRPLPRPLLRNVIVGDTLFLGSALLGNVGAFTANQKRLSFSYALPFFDAPQRTRYQVRLDNYEEGWSSWTGETAKDYTNLPGGTYHFRVRARDVYGRVSEEAGFSFDVLSPWYLSWWAYLVYALLGGGLLAGVVQWRLARLKTRAHELEQIVAERTAQLSQKHEQLTLQAGRLRELDEAKTRFFANISHELRTPLTLIVGPLERLYTEKRGTLGTESEEELGMMLRNGQRLQRLINQILDLTKIEAHALRLDRRPHDLVAFVRRHLRLYEGLAQYQDVDLSFHATAPVLLVAFDAEQMEKVLANLLSNALKFTEPGGAISITVEAHPDAAWMRIEDTGVGIPAEKLAHVFDRFYQVEDSSTRSYEGTGIGLALVKELVVLHGGTVHAESAPGRGSTFIVRIPSGIGSDRMGDPEIAGSTGDGRAAGETMPGEPVAPEAAPASSPNPQLPSVSRFARVAIRNPQAEDQTTVLVVEDNADMRAFVRSILEPAFGVLEAADGEEGLRLAQTALPDLILADIMMPKMDGLSMSRALRGDPTTGSIPIVMLTARAALDDQMEGLGTGVDAYLTKPFNASVLQLQVSNLIDRQHRLREQLRQEPAALEPSSPPQSPFEAQVREIIEQHLSDSQFSVEMLADAVALSRQQLYRRLRDDTGETPVAYIRQFRLERAARLLREQQGNVSEVAYAVGFNSLSYFTRCFHEHFEETPSAFLLRETQ